MYSSDRSIPDSDSENPVIADMKPIKKVNESLKELKQEIKEIRES